MNSARRFRTVTPRLRHNETARSKTIPGLFTSDYFPESLLHTGSSLYVTLWVRIRVSLPREGHR